MPIARSQFGEGLRGIDAGVVHQNIHSTEGRFDRGHEPDYFFLCGDVGLNREPTLACLFYCFDDVAGTVLGLQVVDDDIASCLCQ